MLWEFNMKAGGVFAELVKEDPDPQAIAVTLPKKMTVAETYGASCFVDESTKKAVYMVYPAGETKASEVVLGIVANYSWENVPADGRTIFAEDMDLVSTKARNILMKWNYDTADPN